MVDPVKCSGCGTLIDPLRAGHVAIFDQQFHYFCDMRACRGAFLASFGDVGDDEPWRDRLPSIAPAEGASQIRTSAVPLPEVALPKLPELGDNPALIEPIAQSILTEPPGRLEGGEPRDMGALLLLIAIIAGALAVALTLAGETRLVLGARIMLAAVGAGMLVGRAATVPRDPADPHPFALMAAPLLAIPVAGWAMFTQDASLASEAASLAGVIITGAAVSTGLMQTARRHVSAERAWIESMLDIPGHRDPEGLGSAETRREEVFDLKPGERITVDAGEDVPADVRITPPDLTSARSADDTVDILPWIGATTRVRRKDGDVVVAGARVVRGRLRGVVTWANEDRAFSRVLLDPRRRADALATVVRLSRAIAERWAAAAALVGGLLGYFTGHAGVDLVMVVLAIHAGLANAVIGSLASVHVARGILVGLRRGITYRSADAWERAGRVNLAVFCARGTLLLGEPELAEVEPANSKLDENQLLAIAAGAERAESHPIAWATVRAARARNVRPDGVRNPNLVPGFGVTAVTSGGESLIVGNRAFMLDQRISIATFEERISELEANGRSVILVATGARLAGILAFQDGLRPGARAAVQHLLDAQIEPVLMSGDARETCEAIGRSLDVEHIRPEILPDDRGPQIKRLLETGLSVAVLGHVETDEPALSAADVAVALNAAGGSPAELEVALASDDVRDAALSLALAKRTRIEARVGLALAVIPAIVGAIAVALGILHTAYVPIAALLGGVMGVLHGRALDRLHSPPPAASDTGGDWHTDVRRTDSA